MKKRIVTTCIMLCALTACGSFERENPTLRPISPRSVPVGNISYNGVVLHMSDTTLRDMHTQLEVCMKPAQILARGGTPKKVHLIMDFERDGSMNDVSLQPVDRDLYSKDMAFKKLADNIMSTLQNCHLKNLPQAHYAVWSKMQVTYNESVAPASL